MCHGVAGQGFTRTLSHAHTHAQEKMAFKTLKYLWPLMAILTVLDAVLVFGGTDYLIMTRSRLVWFEVIGCWLLWTALTIYSTWIYRQVTHVCVKYE